MFSFKLLIHSLDKFFFEEKPTEGISFFRVIWISIIFFYYLIDGHNISDFYGPHALISLDTVREQFPYFHANIFHLSNGSYEFTYSLYIFYGIALICSFLGFYTKTSLVAVLFCMVSFHQRNIWALSSSEVLMRTMTILLIFTPCGNSFSVDSIIGKYFKKSKKKRNASVWGLRLIQIQLSVVYIWTAWHKLKGDTWFDGTAVYYATRIDNLTNFPLPYLLDSMTFLKLATWGTLLIEFSLGILIWFKEFRIFLIIIGIIFHLSIEYLMSIPFFEWYMIALLLNFFTPEEYRYYYGKIRFLMMNFIRNSSLSDAFKKRVIEVLRF
jgi:hypothetical protein